MAAARALGASVGGVGASRLLALLCDPDVEIDAVLACLHSEPALSARVLKVANSPYYGLPGRVGTVGFALSVLGLAAIRGIAAAGCLDRALPPRAGQAFDPGRFRLHSLAVASAAQQLSRAVNADIDGEAFMAGLLHDIGLLLMARAHPAAMATFAPPAGLAEGAALALERAHFGVDHAACAGLLVEAWQLPPWLRAALVIHHGALGRLPAESGVCGGGGGGGGDAGAAVNPPAVAPELPAGLSRLPALLAVADHLAYAAGYALWGPLLSAGPPDLPPGPTPADDAAGWAQAATALGLSPETLAAVSASLPEAVTALAGPA